MPYGVKLDFSNSEKPYSLRDIATDAEVERFATDIEAFEAMIIKNLPSALVSGPHNDNVPAVIKPSAQEDWKIPRARDFNEVRHAPLGQFNTTFEELEPFWPDGSYNQK